jgi:hypothetical protein
MQDMTMAQVAPYPHELERLVGELTYKPGFEFVLGSLDRGQGSEGLTLTIKATVLNSLANQPIAVRHLFIVPAASYNRQSWQRWLLDRILDVETHEACEFFRVDGERVYAPHHSEGEDPYTIFEIGDLETASKRWTDK